MFGWQNLENKDWRTFEREQELLSYQVEHAYIMIVGTQSGFPSVVRYVLADLSRDVFFRQPAKMVGTVHECSC